MGHCGFVLFFFSDFLSTSNLGKDGKKVGLQRNISGVDKVVSVQICSETDNKTGQRGITKVRNLCPPRGMQRMQFGLPVPFE